MIVALLQEDDGSIQKRWSSACSSLECSKVLTMEGVRMVEEVEEPKLGDRLPEGKLQEPYYDGEWMSE